MATYIKGKEVANAAVYELYNIVDDTPIKLAESSSINFNLDELNLTPGDYILCVKAKGFGYESSDLSNNIFYTVSSK